MNPRPETVSHEIKYLDAISKVSDTVYSIRLKSKDGHIVEGEAHVLTDDSYEGTERHLDYSDSLYPYISRGMVDVIKVTTAVLKFYLASHQE